MPIEPLQPRSDLKIDPWPTEPMLKVLVAFFAGMIWLTLAITIFGLVYVVIFGLIFFVGHVIFISHVRGNGVRLSQDQLPELYQAVERLARQMGFAVMPEIYLLQAGGVLNALATKFFKSEMVVLYSDLIAACGDDTAARDMIIAHELGHLREGHLRWHWFLLPGYLVPFLGSALSRAREYTCDRYGAAYAGNKEGAMRGLAILAAGAEKGPKVNLKALARQVEDLNTGWLTIGTWLSSHPTLAARVIALEGAYKPDGYTGSRGMYRALGLIGSVYFLPILLLILIISIAGMANLSKAKGTQHRLPRYQEMPDEAPDLPDPDRF